MEAVRDLGCIACWLLFGQYRIAAIHHTDGKTKPGAHFKVLPLCFQHHQDNQGDPQFVAIHQGRKTFIRDFGTDEELLINVQELLK
jgi:hypothetical protein